MIQSLSITFTLFIFVPVPSESFVISCHFRRSMLSVAHRGTARVPGASPEVLPASRVGVTLKACAARCTRCTAAVHGLDISPIAFHLQVLDITMVLILA